MKSRSIKLSVFAMTVVAAGRLAGPILAQPAPAPQARAPQPPPVVSPEISAERRITFRIMAPKAEVVRLNAGDIPGNGATPLSKGTNGIWEVTIGPIAPGAYRYNFNVDGVTVMDPRNPASSESNNNLWSLVNLPGSEFADTQKVPHGGVASVTYFSTSLNKFRRMHIYTPPGYELGKGTYPVFYLLHGAGDSDNAWSTVGRAGFILDNLIAAGKAKPMVVVMPAGHTRSSGFGPRREPPPGESPARPPADEFVQDFIKDIVPHVEKHYRVHTDQAHKAIAGLSMGGGQTINIALPHPDQFAYVGVFSSGVFGIIPRAGAPAPAGPSWEEQHKTVLDDAGLRKGLKLLWFATGKDDFLIETSRATVAMFKKHGFETVFVETSGGHTWINWRDYLNEFAPKLFQ